MQLVITDEKREKIVSRRLTPINAEDVRGDPPLPPLEKGDRGFLHLYWYVRIIWVGLISHLISLLPKLLANLISSHTSLMSKSQFPGILSMVVVAMCIPPLIQSCAEAVAFAAVGSTKDIRNAEQRPGYRAEANSASSDSFSVMGGRPSLCSIRPCRESAPSSNRDNSFAFFSISSCFCLLPSAAL